MKRAWKTQGERSGPAALLSSEVSDSLKIHNEIKALLILLEDNLLSMRHKKNFTYVVHCEN